MALVQYETGVFVVGMFAFCLLLLVIDWAMKKWYQPYLKRKWNNHDTVTSAGIIGTEALRRALERPGSASRALHSAVERVTADLQQKLVRASQAAGTTVRVVSGWADDGVSAAAYRMARTQRWATEGIAPEDVVQSGRPLFQCDHSTVAGKRIGEEARALAKSVDMLVLVSDGSDDQDPYEVIFRDFGGMKIRYNVGPASTGARLPEPEMYNTETILDTLDHDKNK